MPLTIAQIKMRLDTHVGNTLTITSKGRSNTVLVQHGTLRGTYPAVFLVELNHQESAIKRVSYSYTDVLTKNIELDFG